MVLSFVGSKFPVVAKSGPHCISLRVLDGPITDAALISLLALEPSVPATQELVIPVSRSPGRKNRFQRLELKPTRYRKRSLDQTRTPFHLPHSRSEDRSSLHRPGR